MKLELCSFPRAGGTPKCLARIFAAIACACNVFGSPRHGSPAFWSYTLRPLTELLRMRYAPLRWDFGMRYLDRDLPPAVYDRLRDLMFVHNLDELRARVDQASAWGSTVLEDLRKSNAT